MLVLDTVAEDSFILKQGCVRSSLAGGRFSLQISRQRSTRSRVGGVIWSGTSGGPLLVAILNISFHWLDTLSAPHGGFVVAISSIQQPTLHTSQDLP